MQVMNANNQTRIPLTQRCIYQPQLLQNNKVYGACSNFHSVTYRPPGGISDHAIEVLREQFKRDTQGPNAIAARGTFAVEGEGVDRHVHITLVLNNRDRTTLAGCQAGRLLLLSDSTVSSCRTGTLQYAIMPITTD